ncbi:P-loop containing nucleoside triphosphate hydrolase protein [Endogone sp. FLAS-F59071]|nr:P-loop containing nucleoside triphosphate hydrolase protein [Endogone sp. FLAS-F59071]|eukprot:RUS21137.1 P-loop containing nucleoside triphosphate hydrolase protein [Endogone sp. FLAS-F59071]
MNIISFNMTPSIWDAIPLVVVAGSFLNLSYLKLSGFRITDYAPLPDGEAHENIQKLLDENGFNKPKSLITRLRWGVLLFFSLGQLSLLGFLLARHILDMNHNQRNELLGLILVELAGVLPWMYVIILQVLHYTHKLTANTALYQIISVILALTVSAFFKLSLFTELPSHLYLPLDFVLGGIVYTVLCISILVVAGTIPVELDKKLVIETGIGYFSATASALSQATFSWMDKIIWQGNKKPLEIDDIPELLPSLRSQYIWKEFQRIKPAWTLLHRLVLFIARDFSIDIIISIVQICLDFTTPYFLQLLLEYFQHPEGIPKSKAFFYVTLILLTQITSTLIRNQGHYILRRIDVRIRNALSADLYGKSLRMRDTSGMIVKKAEEKKDKPAGDSQPTNTGKIVNLMSVDTNRVANFTNFTLFITTPTSILIGAFMLYRVLGWSAFVGLAVMIVMMPLSNWTTSLFKKFQVALMKAKDERVAITNEFFQYIRVIKFASWENMFAKRVLKAREFELQKLAITYFTSLSFQIMWYGAPVFVTVAAFWSFTFLQHGELTPAKAFTAILLFERLRFPMAVLPQCFVFGLSALVSLQRIADFLNEAEIDIETQTHTVLGPDGEALIGFENVSAQWFVDANKHTSEVVDEARFALRNIDVQFPLGELSIICGPTGAGKSSLLSALLGEMDIISGRVLLPRNPISAPKIVDISTGFVKNSVAYVSQTAWLQNASIRDNILFGLHMEKDRYERVLEACALKRDLEILDDGDMTEIGENGITLSGGQKQRVSLARAVYSRARYVLLDDCLSAVDAHTAKWIYEKCIASDLMKGRTRILVTHHVRLCLPGTKYLVKIDNGRLTVKGEIHELRANGELREILKDEEVDIDSATVVSSGENTIIDDSIEDVADEAAAASSSSSSTQKLTIDSIKDSREADAKTTSTPRKLVQVEHKEEGSIKFKIYKMYFYAAGGYVFWIFLLCIYIATQILQVAENNWLRIWSNAYDSDATNATTANFVSHLGNPNDHTIISPVHIQRYQQAIGALSTAMYGTQDVDVVYYLSIYAAIALAGVLASCLQSLVILLGALKATRFFYEQLLIAVMRAPIRFFDTTPLGRIMARFTKDFETIDTSMATGWGNFFNIILKMITTIVVISLVTPLFLVAALVIGSIFVVIGKLYLTCSRELKRLDSNSKAPIYSQFGEGPDDHSSLRRASSLHSRYAGKDRRGNTTLLFPMERQPMAFYNIDAGLAGFTLTFALQFVELINWSLRLYTQVEMDLNSIERVSEFLYMPQEPIVGSIKPPAAWPEAGRIDVKDLVIQYAPELERVLRGITFTVDPQEKIGVVGRTGSGKSTLATSLFRFVDPTEGSISIDGIDITSLGVDDLRSRLTIIPQDPILFSGTIRSNLDPFDEHDNSELWESLRRVHLIDSRPPSPDQASEAEHVVPQLFANLEVAVSEGGGNFSQGQRQLLCMARALLRNSKIIVMDEATASVDFATDQRIRNTILREFASSTVVCIAHRLRTVIDYDRILVLDHGKIVEFDTPFALLFGPNSKNSVFRDMCEKSGEMETLSELVSKKQQLNESIL